MDVERRGSDPVEETVERLVQLYEEHDRRTPRIQKAANRLTSVLGRPSSVATILFMVIVWMVGNYVASRLGYHPLEGFPSSKTIPSGPVIAGSPPRWQG